MEHEGNKDGSARGWMEKAHAEHRENMYGDLPWKAWGSWFSWGSPIGMGFFVIAIGIFIVLLHLAGLIG
jgi:hypothetical protein